MFYVTLDIILSEGRMFVRSFLEQDITRSMQSLSINAVRDRLGQLKRYQDLPLNMWPHVNVAMQLYRVIDQLELLVDYMPDGEINIDTPFPGGGKGLIEALTFDLERAIHDVRLLTPRESLGGRIKNFFVQRAMQNELDRLSRNLEDGEEPPIGGRIRFGLVRQAISETMKK